MASSHVRAPDPKDVASALRALRELTVQQGPADTQIHQVKRSRPSELSDDTYSSAPSIVPPERAIEQTEEISVKKSPSDRSSPTRRVFRTIVGGIVIAAAAGLAWQAYTDGQINVMVKALRSSIHGVKSNPGSDIAADNAQMSNQTAAVSQLPSTPVVAEGPPELLQQLETIVSDLAVLRHAVEEIASKQDQTSRDIGSFQAAQQNVSQQISSLARATSARTAAQKRAAKLPHLQATNQSTATAPVPVPPPVRPTPSASQSPAN
jgi:hypothetical protein